MKQAVMAVVAGLGFAGMVGCAGIQQQTGAFLGEQNQSQQVALEGGQPVQRLGGSRSNQGQAQNVASQEGSSMAADMAREAASTVKNEVSSSIRSAIRGAFSR